MNNEPSRLKKIFYRIDSRSYCRELSIALSSYDTLLGAKHGVIQKMTSQTYNKDGYPPQFVVLVVTDSRLEKHEKDIRIFLKCFLNTIVLKEGFSLMTS